MGNQEDQQVDSVVPETTTEKVANPVKGKNKDHFSSIRIMKNAGYEHMKIWDKKRKNDLVNTRNILEFLLITLETANQEIAARHRLMKEFYHEFGKGFDVSDEEIIGTLEEQLKTFDIKKSLDEKYQANIYEQSLMNQVQAEKDRKAKILNYRDCLEKNVAPMLAESLCKNETIVNCVEKIRQANLIKQDISLKSHEALLSLQEFSTTFERQHRLNFKKKNSKKSVFYDCYNFVVSVRNLESTLQEYANQIINIIELSEEKEKITMNAISNSFNVFTNINHEYFGQEQNNFHEKSLDGFSKIAKEKNHFKTFSLNNLLREDEMEFIRKRLNIDEPLDSINHMKQWSSMIMTKDNAWCHFLRISCKVQVLSKGLIMKSQKNANLFLCFDDFITIVEDNIENDKKKEETQYQIHVKDSQISKADITEKQVTIHYNARTMFRKQRDVTLMFETNEEKDFFLIMFNDCSNLPQS